MKVNEKGFTLVEIIAVIIVLGLLIMIAVPAINKQLSNFRVNYYDKLESSAKAAGEDYVSDKRFAKPTKLLYSKVIKISELEDEGYIDEVKDYLGNKCDSKDTSYSYVIVVKTGEKEYQYQACLRCSEDEYATETDKAKYNLCDTAWLDNTGIEYVKPGISSDLLYVYYGTTEQEIKEQVGITYDIVKRDRNGEVLAQVENSEAEEDDILYPQNIGELVGKNVNSIVELRYVLPDGETLTRRAVIYKHNAPKVTMTYGNANTVTGKKAGDKYNNGSNEWASKVNVKIEFSPSDIKEITDKINMKTAEYYDPATNKWVDTNCSLSSDKKSCTWTVASNFNKSVKIRVVNQNDRRGDASGNYSIKVDITKPTCASNNGSTTWAKSRTVTESCTDSGGSGCNKGSYAITYPTSSVKNKKTDNITIYDNAGNSQSCPVNVYVDSTPPSSCSVSLNGVSNNGTTSADITLSVKGTDNETDASGIKSEVLDVKLNGSSLGDIRNTSGKNNGKYTVVGTCTDKAGNSKTSATQTFTLSKKITVSYTGNGGSGSTPSTTCGYNENCVIAANKFTKTGYYFTTWKNGSASYSAGGTYKFTSNITLTAQWSPSSYTLTYNNNGGSGCGTKSVTYDSTYGALCNPSRTGYTFAGWYTSASGGSVVNSSTKVTKASNHTIYAHWTSNSYTLTYNNNGGSGCTSKSVTYGAAYGALCTPSKTGNIFAGWYTAASGGSVVNANTTVTTASNHTIYAHWTPSTYTLTYNNNGGSGCTSKSVTYGSTLGNLCTATRSGYNFVGWYSYGYKDAPLNYYADTYADLKNAFGYNARSLYDHYQANGIREGRRVAQYIPSDVYNTAGGTTIYAGWIESAPSISRVAHESFLVCPCDTDVEFSREQACWNDQYYNRMRVTVNSYSGGVLNFTVRFTMNDFYSSWSGQNPTRTLCIANSSGSCVSNLLNLNIGSYGWLGEGASTSYTFSVNLQGWSKGSYRLLLVGGDDTFRFQSRNTVTFFTIS